VGLKTPQNYGKKAQDEQKGIVLSILINSWMNTVELHTQASSLQREIDRAKADGKTIGFVPTMGALHEGHLNLIRRAQRENDCVVVSIFVNPTQFNNPRDLELYPRMLDQDQQVLSTLGFDVLLFAPSTSEVYPENDVYQPIDLKGLENVLEGTFRPGHFQGVVHVVRNLFRMVLPHKAYFGRKDLQQLAVIRHMTRFFDFDIEIVACDTLRESSGLAMSSRNLRLSPEEREEALIIYQTLNKVKEWSKTNSPGKVKQLAIEFFPKDKLRLEYLEIVNDHTFEPLNQNWSEHSSCCIAAYCGDVRLIDNMPCKTVL
jgi:pantoate--beta-alanine ligase